MKIAFYGTYVIAPSPGAIITLRRNPSYKHVIILQSTKKPVMILITTGSYSVPGTGLEPVRTLLPKGF